MQNALLSEEGGALPYSADLGAHYGPVGSTFELKPCALENAYGYD